MAKRDWDYDTSVFKKIDTTDKAYWLGFIVADGYIFDNLLRDNKSTACGLRIRLAESDGNHLEGLNELMDYSRPLTTVKNYGIYENAQDLTEFLVNSRDITIDLKNLGVQINGGKSCNEKFIKLDNDILTKNFILGIFDGDGSISNYKSWSERDNKYRNNSELSLFGSFEMISDIEKFLVDKLKVTFQKISTDHRCDSLYRSRTSSKRNIEKIYNFLYNENCTKYYMRRKEQKMKESFIRE